MIDIGSTSRHITATEQIVTIEGAPSNYIKCTDCGLQGASFTVVGKRFDDPFKEFIRDKLIGVTVDNIPLFSGFVQSINSICSYEDDSFSFAAESVDSILMDTWIGQFTEKNVLTYKAVDGWTLPKIIEDLFDQLGELKRYITLGNTAALQDKSFVIGKELVIRNCTYEEALDQVLEITGTVIYRPRFTPSGCRIDFYNLAKPATGTSFCSLAPIGGNSTSTDLQAVSIADTSIDYVDQVSIWGVRQAIVTIFGNADPEVTPEEYQLQPDWDASYTQLVRANPELAKPDSPGHIEGYQYVDRRYKLPRCLWDVLKLSNLPIRKPRKDEDGNPIVETEKERIENKDVNPDHYALQAMQWKTQLQIDESGTTLAHAVADTLPTLVGCDWDLENNTVTFAEACTNFLSVDVTDNKLPAQKFAPAPIAITIGIELPDDIFNFKTPTSKRFAKNLNVLREDFKFVQYTNIGFPIRTRTGEHTFPHVYIFTEDVSPPQVFGISEAVIIQNDITYMMTLANDLLQAKNARPKTLNVKLPYISGYFQVGNKLIIDNMAQEMAGDTYIITNIRYDLVDFSMTIEADNSKPLKFIEI